MKDTYDDIINLEYNGVKNHKKMSVYNRSAQFAPFAALTGYDSAISETSRLTDEKMMLSTQMIERLNLKLSIVKEYLDTAPSVKITYFIKDEKKSGGSYKVITGTIKKVDEYASAIIMDDKILIYINDIYDIESDIFHGIEY